MTKLFLKALGFIILLTVLFGVALPFLISAKSTVAFIGGIILLLCVLVGLIYALERSLRNEKSGE
jgi:hypothetical protein